MVAGDVAEDSKILLRTLSLLREVFTFVFFIPGNHDLWVKGHGITESFPSSVEKLSHLTEKCGELGVYTYPIHFTWREKGIWIVPLYAWYHPSFDQEKDIPPDMASIPPVEKVFQDFRRCVWPPGLDPLQTHVAKYFDDLNDKPPNNSLSPLSHSLSRLGADVIISFSHFLPRIELIPEKRFLFYPHLAKAVGSDFLAKRVSLLTPSLHVFGHTHFGWDMEMEGVRYVQAPLGYPHERKQRPASMYVGDGGEEERMREGLLAPVMVYDGREEGMVCGMWSSWPARYNGGERRDPQNVELAPWVRKMWPKP